VGDLDPLVAIEDAVRTFHPDEIVLSTHPPGRLALARARCRQGGSGPLRHPGDARHRRPRGPGRGTGRATAGDVAGRRSVATCRPTTRRSRTRPRSAAGRACP
jgi:hypothetical protein